MNASIDKIANVFGMGRIQDLLTLLTLLVESGHTINDLRLYIEEQAADRVARRMDEEAFQRAFTEKAERCPACGAPMNLAPVNTGPRDQVGGNYRSQWVCPDGTCMETVFNLETAAAIVQKMGIGPPPAKNPPRRPAKRKPCGGCNGKA